MKEAEARRKKKNKEWYTIEKKWTIVRAGKGSKTKKKHRETEKGEALKENNFESLLSSLHRGVADHR